jgi:hypothetical protein
MLTFMRRLVWANVLAAVNNRQIVMKVRAVFIGIPPIQMAGDSGGQAALCRNADSRTMGWI